MIKKISKLSILLLVIFLVSGCGSKDVDIVNTSTKKGKTADNGNQNINVNGSGQLKCYRNADAYSGLTADLKYYVTYEKGYMLILHSVEKISGDNQEALDEYEDAYNKIKEKYKDLQYYDFNVTRDKNSVTCDININYTKVDTKKIIEIETDSMFDSKNRPVLKKWLEKGKERGLVCEGVIE